MFNLIILVNFERIKILFFRTNRMSGRLNVSEGVACGRPVQRTPCIYYPQKYETPIHVKSTKIVIFVSDTLHFYKSLSGFENFWPRPGNHRYRKFFYGRYRVLIGTQIFFWPVIGTYPYPKLFFRLVPGTQRYPNFQNFDGYRPVPWYPWVPGYRSRRPLISMVYIVVFYICI